MPMSKFAAVKLGDDLVPPAKLRRHAPRTRRVALEKLRRTHSGISPMLKVCVAPIRTSPVSLPAARA